MGQRSLMLVMASLVMPVHASLHAQSIQGRAWIEGTGVGVDGATVTLMTPDGDPLISVQTSETGEFWISLEEPGSYLLGAERLGLRPFRASVVVRDREVVEVALQMAEEAIPLEPLVITARRTIRQGTLDEFYDRMERNRRRGVGQFITRDEVENSPAATTTFMMGTVPGLFLVASQSSGSTGISGQSVQMRHPQGGYCTPAYFLNGMPTSWDRLPPMEDIEGVEVYRGRFERVEGYWPSECGAVYMWRRTDWGNPFSWSRLWLAAGFGVVALLLAIF